MTRSAAGVLSGTPTQKPVAGLTPVTVQVIETVTTLDGRRKAKTTTVQSRMSRTVT